jgi:hypothetical protein
MKRMAILMILLLISSTYYGINRGFEEANPLKKWHIKYPPLTIAVHFTLDFALVKVSNMIYKKNKTLGLAFLVGLNLFKAYVIYRNIKILGD